MKANITYPVEIKSCVLQSSLHPLPLKTKQSKQTPVCGKQTNEKWDLLPCMSRWIFFNTTSSISTDYNSPASSRDYPPQL